MPINFHQPKSIKKYISSNFQMLWCPFVVSTSVTTRLFTTTVVVLWRHYIAWLWTKFNLKSAILSLHEVISSFVQTTISFMSTKQKMKLLNVNINILVSVLFCDNPLADPRSNFIFFSFSCSFGEFGQNNRLVLPLPQFPSGKSWIRHCCWTPTKTCKLLYCMPAISLPWPLVPTVVSLTLVCISVNDSVKNWKMQHCLPFVTLSNHLFWWVIIGMHLEVALG